MAKYDNNFAKNSKSNDKWVHQGQHSSNSTNPGEASVMKHKTRTPEHETRNAQRATRTVQRVPRIPQPVYAVDLNLINYADAWQLQTDIVSARHQRKLTEDIVLFLEHPPVFTLGRRGGSNNLLVSKSFIKRSGIALTQVERGGDITYHGPGQLVVYPIIDLESARISVVDFVASMEAIMIKTAENWGVKAERNPANRGVWVGTKKLGSIGIALRKGISFHGMALNINLDLVPFSWIQPCGLQGVSMTSLKQEYGKPVPVDSVREDIKAQFQEVLGFSLLPMKLEDIQKIVCPTRKSTTINS
jgi:lipoate-protein ligase B